MKDYKNLLRISYWVGAIVDAKAALIMFFPNLLPQLFTAIAGDTADIASTAYKFLAVMIFSWTCLLVWADRKPVERKGVLILTLFPVLTGLISLRFYSILTGRSGSVLYLIFTALLIVLGMFFLFSYMMNSREKRYAA